MKRNSLAAVAALSSLAVLITTAPPVHAKVDTTPPVLKVPAYTGFVSGSQISNTGSGDDAFDAYFPGTTMLRKVSWSATDDSGICGYDVYDVLAGDDPQPLVTDTMDTSYEGLATDYDDQEGGGSFKTMAWQIVAHDCAGNTTTMEAANRPVVTQEDGWTYGYLGVTLSYSGAWGTSTCACWSADQTRKTSTKGASVKIKRTFSDREPVALVMERAPDRGKFRLYVDGVYKRTIDTGSATVAHRSVVWTSRMDAGAHVIRIVNSATKGRPRIDLDAVMNDSPYFW